MKKLGNPKIKTKALVRSISAGRKDLGNDDCGMMEFSLY